MANAITVIRVLALFGVLGIMYFGSAAAAQWCGVYIAVIILADALDGWVARRRNEVNQFGAIFDIVGDRVVENVLWVVFADLDLVPIWVPLLVLTRGFVVDGLRSSGYSEGMTPFGENSIMRSAFTKWLTGGRFMRAFFGTTKAAGFVFLATLWAARVPHEGRLFADWFAESQLVLIVGWGLVWLAVVLTVVRAIPVIVDSTSYLKAKNVAEV
ncbi:MAG: CDP-alcohol phosphatidyltransferase family protein [Propionibacteriaceae bacterium]|nr:CDP-alcohol phosphatidyltransferase family protein [Propionibacteriaceae bacterium]